MVLVSDDGENGSGRFADILNKVVGQVKSAMPPFKPQQPAQTQEQQPPVDLSKFLDYPSGGGSSVDHFFDINPLDQAMFDQNVKQQNWQNEFDLTQFNWQKANDDRDYALAVGDLDLARQKQADANYWQGKSYELEQQRMALDERMNSADNATRTNIAQMEAASRAETARIAAQADKYSADLRLQEGLANATNDQERNRVLLAHEQEVAAIAKMEDETKRMIAAGDQKIGGFNAETARMAQMGDVALKNNQFLLDASKSPRDLFGLYFMQRGITPDWDSLAAGNPTQGEGLKVYDPMKAYNPNITMPQDFEMAAGNAFNGVGNSSNISLNTNPFIQMGMQQTQQQPPQQQPQPQWGTPSFASGTDRYQRLATNAVRNSSTNNANTLDFGVTSSVPQGNGYSPVSSPLYAPTNSQAMMTPNSSAKIKTAPIQSNPQPMMAPPKQQAQPAFTPPYQPQPMTFSLPQMQTQASHVNNGFSPVNSQLQQPGYTREPAFLTGDSAGVNPWGDGAKPELIENPTQAPIRVKNTMQTAADFGIMPSPQGGQQQPPMQPPMRGQGFNIQDYIRQLLEMYSTQGGQVRDPRMYGERVARYPIGTDLSQQYANMGMSQLWQNSSGNDHLQGVENIPTWLQTLADYGTPIAPSLANSVTGGVSPTLNLASAFNQRGGGILPSLQTLNKQSAGENQLFQGYLEGPVGMPAQDTLDFIGRPTQNLRTAQRSSAIMS